MLCDKLWLDNLVGCKNIGAARKAPNYFFFLKKCLLTTVASLYISISIWPNFDQINNMLVTWFSNLALSDNRKKQRENPQHDLLTLLKSGSNDVFAFGVAITFILGDFLERGLRVFKWQWSSRLCVMSKQSNSGSSLNCTNVVQVSELVY